MLIKNVKFEFLMKFQPYTTPDTNQKHLCSWEIVFCQKLIQTANSAKIARFQQVKRSLNIQCSTCIPATNGTVYTLSIGVV